MFVTRLRIIIGIIFLVALVFVSRLYFLQVVKTDDFKARAEHQYISRGGLFDRGAIFFEKRDGTEITAADVKDGYSIAIAPVKIKDAKTVYDKLSPILKISAEDFFLRASKPNDIHEEIADNVSSEVAQKILEMNITGVEVVKTRWRYYPLTTLASQTLGMVGKDDKSRGYGLEEFYDKVLNRDSQSVYSNFFAQIKVLVWTKVSKVISLQRLILKFKKH
jgi:cell division protein FtsI/penicillin-binding protein 2